MHNNRKVKQIANKPDFLGIGAPKTATTWLSHCLSKHSQVWLPPFKELGYFDRCEKTLNQFLKVCLEKLSQFIKAIIKGNSVERPLYMFNSVWLSLSPQHPLFVLFHMLTYPYLIYRLGKKDMDNLGWYTKFLLGRLRFDPEKWYVSLFEPKGQQICGEFTVGYSTLSDSSIEYMLSFNKNIRIIYLVRNPIEREWSNISMHFGNAVGSLSLLDVQKWANETQKASDYLVNLKRYLKHVAPQNLFLGFYDDILFHKNRFLAAVQEFLDVPVEDLSSKPQHSGGYKGIKLEYAAYLAQRNIRKIEEMASVFGGYTQCWLDVATELCQTDTTIHSDETFLSTPFANNDLWRSRWKRPGVQTFQSGPLSSLSCVNKLIP